MAVVSIVVPCYNEEESLPLLFEELRSVTRKIRAAYPETSFEVLLVDDGSTDKTLDTIQDLSEQEAALPESMGAVHYLSFSRNFGKEAAIYAGLQHARGEYVALMDADLQDPPSLLFEMYETLLNEDYDNVATRRSTRENESRVRSFFSRLFYKIMNKISDAGIVDGARDYRLMKRIMVDAIVSMGEYNRFSKGIFSWVGFKTKWISYENVNRQAGKTTWNFFSLFVYSLEGITSFSTIPLSIAALSGVILCFVALLVALFVIIRTIAFGDPVAGWPSLVCIIMFIGGLQLFCLGILGQYLAKVFLETKHRPQYLIRKTDKDMSLMPHIDDEQQKSSY